MNNRLTRTAVADVDALADELCKVSAESFIDAVLTLGYRSDYPGDREKLKNLHTMDEFEHIVSANPMGVVRAIVKDHSFNLDDAWFVFNEDLNTIHSFDTEAAADYLNKEVYAVAEMLTEKPELAGDLDLAIFRAVDRWKEIE